jgi:lipoprotein-releasing system permease protein
MSYPFFIALRYLKGRHKRAPISLNTLISIGGVALGVMTLIVVLSVMSGFENDLKQKILGTNSPIIVTTFNDKGVTDIAGTESKILKVPHVLAAAPFTYSEVMLTSPSGVSGIILKGIDPKYESKVTDLKKDLVKGSLDSLNPEAGKPNIIIGRELSLMLNAQVGDKVRVVEGSFTDFNGTVEEVYPDKGKARVLVSFFNRETPIEVDLLQIERL